MGEEINEVYYLQKFSFLTINITRKLIKVFLLAKKKEDI